MDITLNYTKKEDKIKKKTFDDEEIILWFGLEKFIISKDEPAPSSESGSTRSSGEREN